MKCSKCKKEKDETEFKAKNDRIVKQCSACREMCKKWRAKNKERVKLYNNFTIETTKKSKIKGKLGFSIRNIYNQKNPKWVVHYL